jgi:hypothetical protein
MKQTLNNYRTRLVIGIACIAIGMICWNGGNTCQAQTPANLSSDLQDIVKLAQAKMPDEVILATIKNSGKVYKLSVDDILYLNSQGVSTPVISALQHSGDAPAPTPTPAPVNTPAPAQPQVYTPAPAPTPAYAAPPAYAPPVQALADSFGTDGGLNTGLWTTQSAVLSSLAAFDQSPSIMPMLAFGPAGMQLSGVNGPHQFTGVSSVASYVAPFDLTATVSGLMPHATPFVVYLVSADLRQWLSVAGHLGGAGEPGLHVNVPFIRGNVGGEPPSRDHGVWVNYTTKGFPISALGHKIFEFPQPGVPYTIQMSVDANGFASASLLDPAGIMLGGLNGMSVGNGPFYVVLAERNGQTAANWQSVQLTPLGSQPQPMVAMTAPPETPTFDYFQAHLTPYGQWIDVPDIGSAWVPAEANDPGWRPYMDAGQWQYTDAGWYWQSDYPWGDIAFHYGRWINNAYTSGRWAWVPAYDWAPSWVAWREGDGGLGWAPLPWGVEFRVGWGLYWNGALVVDGVDFGLGFDAFVFVGFDHFWGGDYRRFAFDRVRARDFYARSQSHAGYRMEGGRLRAEGLGRDHMRAITHHEVVERKATEVRRTEEHNNFAKRTEQHQDLKRPLSRPTGPGTARPGEATRTTDRFGSTPDRGPGTTTHPGSTFGGAPGITTRSASTGGTTTKTATTSKSSDSKSSSDKKKDQ